MDLLMLPKTRQNNVAKQTTNKKTKLICFPTWCQHLHHEWCRPMALLVLHLHQKQQENWSKSDSDLKIVFKIKTFRSFEKLLNIVFRQEIYCVPRSIWATFIRESSFTTACIISHIQNELILTQLIKCALFSLLLVFNSNYYTHLFSTRSRKSESREKTDGIEWARKDPAKKTGTFYYIWPNFQANLISILNSVYPF